MGKDREGRPVREIEIDPGEVVELTREDIGENEIVQVIAAHTPVLVGDGVVAWLVDPHTVMTDGDMISFPRAALERTKLWAPEDDTVPQFVFLMPDAPEDADG